MPFAVIASSLAWSGEASAEEGRFDAQVFRPSAAPRDLIMVQKSEVIGHLSPVVGLFTDIALNPLVLIDKSTNQAISAVAARLQVTGLVGIGFFNWVDVTLAAPFVAWQSSDNLRPFGSEGTVQSPAVGDLRASVRVAIPYLNRRDEIKKGFGMALTGNVNFPTGTVKAFAGDGRITGGPSIVADYRFNFGLLIAANVGLWLRPDKQFAGVRIGDMASVGVAAEMYVLQRYGISIVGEVYGYPSIRKFPDSPRQIPAEVLLGIRWQSKHGITITAGGSFGAACGFGAPAFRLFNSITWQPKTSQEQDEINRLQQRDIDDPDHDGLIGDADKCPFAAGKPENYGCPDKDSDGDGVIDREDECPDVPAGPGGKRGCPTVYIKGDEIVIMDQVHFATDKDIILDVSKPILEAVAQVLVSHPEIREVRIEGHTDIRASDAYNLNLSQRRVSSVRAFLLKQGIDETRLVAKGFGHTAPVYDDAGCIGPDDSLTPSCRFMTSKNRRVVFRIVKRGAPPPKPITGARDGNASVLPSKDGVLPNQRVLPSQSNLPTNKGVLPNGGVLPQGGNLPQGSVLPQAGDNANLPKKDSVLPSGGILPKQGTPKKDDAPKQEEPPKKKDDKKKDDKKDDKKKDQKPEEAPENPDQPPKRKRIF